MDLDGDFTPYYVVPDDKKKNVQNLKAALKDASEVLLATDPDREGESISWHLSEVLKPKVPVRRIEFHEITEEAVNDALAHARDINQSLVRAQESRRIVDRLYGYSLSPVLWKKVQTGLSAGRVQSVAVRLIVEREEARRAFRTSTFWDLEARLSGEGKEFPATLVRLGDARVATGKDFDSATGELKTRGVRHLDEPAARDAGGRARTQPALDRHVGRGQAWPRASGAALHHLHAHAGSQPEAWLLHRPHDADRAAAVPGRGDRQRRDRRPHHVSPHGLDHAQREGAERIGARHRRDVRRANITTARAGIRPRSRTRRKRTRPSGPPTSGRRRRSWRRCSSRTSCACTT